MHRPLILAKINKLFFLLKFIYSSLGDICLELDRDGFCMKSIMLLESEEVIRSPLVDISASKMILDLALSSRNGVVRMQVVQAFSEAREILGEQCQERIAG
jgi:hypothetical protein